MDIFAGELEGAWGVSVLGSGAEREKPTVDWSVGKELGGLGV